MDEEVRVAVIGQQAAGDSGQRERAQIARSSLESKLVLKKKPRISGAFRFRVGVSSSYLDASAKIRNVAVDQSYFSRRLMPAASSRRLIFCPLPLRCHPRFSASIRATLDRGRCESAYNLASGMPRSEVCNCYQCVSNSRRTKTTTLFESLVKPTDTLDVSTVGLSGSPPQELRADHVTSNRGSCTAKTTPPSFGRFVAVTVA